MAKLLDGSADAPDDYPFPDTTPARLLEHVMERMQAEVDDFDVIEMVELLIFKSREKAEAEHLQFDYGE